MGPAPDRAGLIRMARFGAAAVACLFAANCAKNSTVDAKYGVSASERVVQTGDSVPKGGGTYRVGKPYVVAGRTYVPEENTNYRAEGIASWYGDEFHGRKTANGEIFDMTSITAAHPTLPIPSYVRVTNLKNQRSLVVRVNDRGPYANDRIIDLSVRSAKLLDFHSNGLARVRVEYIGRAPLAGSDDTKLAGTLREHGKTLDSRPTVLAVASPNSTSSQKFAEAKPYNRDYFDATPVANRGAQRNETPRAPMLASAQPAQLETEVEAEPELPPVVTAPRGSMMASARYQQVPTPAELAPRSLGTLPAPVSAYAAPRYDGSAGMVSGRGLY